MRTAAALYDDFLLTTLEIEHADLCAFGLVIRRKDREEDRATICQDLRISVRLLCLLGVRRGQLRRSATPCRYAKETRGRRAEDDCVVGAPARALDRSDVGWRVADGDNRPSHNGNLL